MANRSFFAELKRRNVLRAAALYVGAAWALSQGVAQLLPVFDFPNWVVRWFVIAVVIGFPFAMLFSWYYEWTPHGIQRESEVDADASVTRATDKKLDRWIIAILIVAVVLLLANTFVLHKDADVDIAPGKSVAVLPLLNESGDPQQDYFSDGLSEELISALGQVRDLKVIGRNSSFQFRGKQQDDNAGIGRKLGVATLLEGTVRKLGDQIRIVASLINASDGSQLWSQTYDRQLKDVFAVQSEIATSVAGALKTTLLGKTIESADRPPSGNLDAYNAFLQGKFYAARRNRDDYAKAVGYFQKAIALDPDYALAYARLAIAEQWFNDWVANGDERKIASAQARANAIKAVELAPDSALALGALGINQAWSNFDYPSADATLKKAVKLDPSNPEILYQLADVTACLGRLDEAVAMMRNVLRLEPLNASYHFYTGQFLLAMEHFDAAQTELQRAVDLQPNAEVFRAYLAIALLERGQSDQALEVAKTEPQDANRRWALAQIHFARHEDAQGESTLKEMLRLDANYGPSNIAMVYAMRGNSDQAFLWLNRALAIRDPGVATMYELPYLIPKLRKDPRLAVLLKKLNLPTPDEVGAQSADSGK
ncbi:MAG TPA: tetratricopeptide repeat protein [Rudaea sp.]|uniref:tetratricopeptide repeat protein n=1 Tax=Rudaea sp. TaxID=2136325 RepID=UPI002F9515C3